MPRPRPRGAGSDTTNAVPPPAASSTAIVPSMAATSWPTTHKPTPKPLPPLVLSDHALEAAEDAHPVLGRDARAVVADGDSDLRVQRLGPHLDGPGAAILDRVGDEVVDDLLHGQVVPAASKAGRNDERDRASGIAGRFGKGFHDLTNQPGQVEGGDVQPELAAGQAGYVQKCRRPLEVVVHGVLDAHQPLLDLLHREPAGAQAGQQQVELADHRRHRVAQLMRRDRDEDVARGDRGRQLGMDRRVVTIDGRIRAPGRLDLGKAHTRGPDANGSQAGRSPASIQLRHRHDVPEDDNRQEHGRTDGRTGAGTPPGRGCGGRWRR